MPRRLKTDPVDDVEKGRRAKISKALKLSEKQIAYHDSLRGVLKGPDSLETKAAKSASHLAKKGSREWLVYYQSALTSYEAQAKADKQLEALRA